MTPNTATKHRLSSEAMHAIFFVARGGAHHSAVQVHAPEEQRVPLARHHGEAVLPAVRQALCRTGGLDGYGERRAS